jgi:hypothetical protein
MEECKPGSYCPNPTKFQVKLFRMLKELGIDSILQYWDGSRHIPVAIPNSRLYVDFDGIEQDQHFSMQHRCEEKHR